VATQSIGGRVDKENSGTGNAKVCHCKIIVAMGESAFRCSW